MRIQCARRARSVVGLAALLIICGCASARYPAISDEGFPKLPGTGFDAAYLAEDSDLSAYSRFRVEPCSVSFRESWLRDQNYERELRDRVTTEDMRRIERDLAARCQAIFSDELAEMSEHPPAADEKARVLVLRPSIVDLDLAAPDILAPGRSRSYARSTGSMTLRLELVGASSGGVVGRIIDRRMAGDKGRATLATRSGNEAETNIVLRSWALLLVDFLESEHAPSRPSDSSRQAPSRNLR